MRHPNGPEQMLAKQKWILTVFLWCFTICITRGVYADGIGCHSMDILKRFPATSPTPAYSSGNVGSLAISGTTLYAVDKVLGVRIFDVTVPEQPVELPGLDLQQPYGPVFINGTILISESSSTGSVLIIDVSDPHIPVVASEIVLDPVPDFSDPGSLGIAFDGVLMHAISLFHYRIYDLSDPYNPVLVGSYEQERSFYNKIILDGTIAITMQDQDYVIVDIHDPTSPSEIARTPMVDDFWVNGLWKNGSVLYIAPAFDPFISVDVSDPMNPVVLHEGSLRGLRELAFFGDRMYSAAADLYTHDLTDPSTPVQIEQFDTPGASRDFEFVGDVVYIADGAGGLLVADISRPQSSPIVGSDIAEYRKVPDIVLFENHTFIAAERDGLLVHDVSDPAHPKLVGEYFFGATTITDLNIDGDLLYVNGDIPGMAILDISDPKNLVQIGNLGTVNGVVVFRDGLIYKRLTNGIEIYDHSNLTTPKLLGSINVSYNGRSHAVCGTTVYFRVEPGIAVIDAQDPKNPILVDIIETEERSPLVLACVDNLLLGALAYGGLYVYDISDPLSPIFLSELDLPGSPRSMSVQGTHAYIPASTNSGLQRVSVADPLNPVLDGFAVGVPAGSVAIGDGLAYVGGGGLTIVDVSDNCVCQADFTDDGQLDIFDAFEFVTFYQNQHPSADFTEDEVFDIYDVIAFLDAFSFGCVISQ